MMNIRQFVAMVFITLTTTIISGCPSGPKITPQPQTVTDQEMCIPACANLQRLGCEEGKPIITKRKCTVDYECKAESKCVNGKCADSCVRFCIETENMGVWLDPTCVSRIDSCSNVNSCPLSINVKY